MSEYKDQLADAQKALDRAREAYDAVERRRGDARREAADAVTATFKDEMDAAMVALSAATRDVVAAQDATPNHPWTGKRVVYRRNTGRWGAINIVETFGVVNTCRSTTEFPANTSNYRKPKIGEGFVRLLKSDGKPGARFERLGRDWKLDG